MKFIKIILALLLVLAAIFLVRTVLYDDLYPLKYKDYIVEYSEEYNVDPYLIMAMINRESKYNKDAVSPKGAVGLMQLTESTAQWIAKSMGEDDFETGDLYEPETNIKMGIWYIDNLSKEFGSTELVLAAYNAGRGNVDKWLKDSDISKDGQALDNIPYLETSNYLKKVLADQRVYRLLYKID